MLDVWPDPTLQMGITSHSPLRLGVQRKMDGQSHYCSCHFCSLSYAHLHLSLTPEKRLAVSGA